MGQVKLDIHLSPTHLNPFDYGLTGDIGGDGGEFCPQP